MNEVELKRLYVPRRRLMPVLIVALQFQVDEVLGNFAVGPSMPAEQRELLIPQILRFETV
jgi:hypothetical protein